MPLRAESKRLPAWQPFWSKYSTGERYGTGGSPASHTYQDHHDTHKKGATMTVINTYLNFPGNTEEAFNFYKSVFGGEFAGEISRFKDTPDGDKLPENEREKVMHVALPIGAGNMLMGTDSLESMGQSVTMGNNIHISIHPESKEETERLFNGLSAGGTIEMPLEKMFWGAWFASFTDQFGVRWMINYDDSSSD